MYRRFKMLAGILMIGLFASAQTFDIAEKSSVTQDGIEYGYQIRSEQIKEAGGEEYSRFEISFYITNKSGCNRYYALPAGSYTTYNHQLLASFNISNANGKRLTSKNAQIRAREFYTPVKIKERIDGKDKERTETVQVGYIFRDAETLRDQVIVLVPKGERPQVSCTSNHPPVLQ